MKSSVWVELFLLMIAVVLRVLMGYLATAYRFIRSWLVWFNVLCIAVAVILGIHFLLVAIPWILGGTGKKTSKPQTAKRRKS